MAKYDIPKLSKPPKARKKQVVLVSSGDLRDTANEACWPNQKEMEDDLTKVLADCGYELVRAHPYKPDVKHGFISSQKEGMEVFRGIDPKARLIVAEAVWQYSHHILHGLTTHQGPILTAANWSGTWPGLVGMLNLNGSLTKAGVPYSTLWSEDFSDDWARSGLKAWVQTGVIEHDMSHVRDLDASRLPAAEAELGRALAAELQQNKAIMFRHTGNAG